MENKKDDKQLNRLKEQFQRGQGETEIKEAAVMVPKEI
jgi:hypothetical protein